MADMDSSQHVQAFIGHLLTNPEALREASAAGTGEAITGVINKYLGTNLSSEEGEQVAKEAGRRLGALHADPSPIAEARANIMGGPY